MNAEIHPDGTLRVTPESMTEQVALMRWLQDSREPGDSSKLPAIKACALMLTGYKPRPGAEP